MQLKGSLYQAGASLKLKAGSTAELTIAASNSAAATVTLPATTTTLVGRDTTDTLTGKTVVAAANTITTAASGNLASTELNAALSELQTDIDTRATSAALTAHTSATSAHGVTGALVGTTDTQTLTGKTISGASNTLSSIPNSATTAVSANTPSAIVARDGSGNFTAGTITATLAGNASSATTAGSATTANSATTAGSITGNLTGDVTSTGMATTVATVGGKTAAAVAQSVTDTVAAASANTVSTLVKRDGSGNFAAGTITANLTGNVTGNTSGTAASITGNLTGDVTSTGMATTVAAVGGKTAAAVAQSVTDTVAATSANTLSAIVKRDGSGNFTAGTVTAALTGNVTGDLTGNTVSTYHDLTQQVGTLGSNPASGKSRLYAKTDKRLYLLDSSGNESPAGAGLTPSYQSSGFTAASGQNYLVDTSSAAVSATLPSGAAFSTIRFTDDKSTWATFNFTITPATGQKIQGLTTNENLICNVSGAWVELNWDATTGAWVMSAPGYATSVSGGASTGTGSGEKNYLTASASGNTGWQTVAGTSAATTQATLTASTDSSASVPRPYTTTTALKLVATAAVGGGAVSAFAWSTFQLDPADYGKKLKVQWDQNISGYTANDYSVEVRCSATVFTTPARTSGTLLPLSTDSSAVTGIPALQGTFRTTFDAPGSATPYIAVYFVPKTSAASTLWVSDLVVGPGVVTQGAAVTAPQSIALVPNNFGTVLNTSYMGSRVGQHLLVDGRFKTGTPGGAIASIGLPSGYTIDTSALSTNATGQAVGTWETVISGTAAAFYANSTSSAGILFFDGTDTANIYLAYQSGAGVFTKFNANAIAPGGLAYDISFNFRVPVSQWAGSGTVNVVQNDVEYLSNSDSSSTTSVTASGYQYGPAGQVFGSNWSSLGTTYTRRVQTLTPISATDDIVFQVSEDGGVTWGDLSVGTGNICGPAIQQGTNFYGVQIRKVDSTHVDVNFNQGGRFPSNATYAGNGAAWSTLGGSGYYWRVVKRKSGQAVGFGAATNTARGLVYDPKQYVAGTAYTNGTPQFSTTGWTTTRGVLIPYQTTDGAWRLKFNVYGSITSTNAFAVTLNGVTFKTGPQQGVTATCQDTNTWSRSYANGGANTFSVTAGAAGTAFMAAADVELDSKPTWAD